MRRRAFMDLLADMAGRPISARAQQPGDLPIEQASKFELVVNPKTAKALCLTIPPIIMGRAEGAIE